MDHPIDVETSIVPVAARAPARSPRARVPLQERWRHLERRLKRHVFRALGLVLAPVVVAPPDWSARPHRVLFLRHDRIGDMVLTTGILRAIRIAQPNLTLDVLASKRNASVLDHNPHVATVHVLDASRPWSYWRALREVRRTGYDAVIDPMVTGPSLTTTLLMWASGAAHRIGAAERDNDYVLTVRVARLRGAVHVVDHLAALLAAFGIEPRAPAADRSRSAAVARSCSGWGLWRPELFLTPQERDFGERQWTALAGVEGRIAQPPALGRLVVNVSAGSWWRYWPEDRFIAAVRQVRSIFPHVSVLIVGAPEDERRMERIGCALGVPLARRTSFRQLVALVAASDVVLTADTSVTHLASAFSKRVVALYARSGGAHWGPYGTAGRTVSTPAISLEQLPVEPVVDALATLLSTPPAE
jgi:ADP-heptose:LPS heptosyltransferase